jgi:hypothetical protein
MKILHPVLATHIASGLSTFCRCGRVDRRGGLVMGLTDFDCDLAFDAVTYKAALGSPRPPSNANLGMQSPTSMCKDYGEMISIAPMSAPPLAARICEDRNEILLAKFSSSPRNTHTAFKCEVLTRRTACAAGS